VQELSSRFLEQEKLAHSLPGVDLILNKETKEPLFNLITLKYASKRKAEIDKEEAEKEAAAVEAAAAEANAASNAALERSRREA
jgi:hypothetical protein